MSVRILPNRPHSGVTPWANARLSDLARALLRECPVRINLNGDSPSGPWLAHYLLSGQSEVRMHGADLDALVLRAVRSAVDDSADFLTLLEGTPQ